jgi:hypothetical protein
LSVAAVATVNWLIVRTRVPAAVTIKPA